MSLGIVGRALVVTSTAGSLASITLAASGLIGHVSVGVANHEAQAGDGHLGQLVRLGRNGSVGGGGHEGDGGDGAEKHLDWI